MASFNWLLPLALSGAATTAVAEPVSFAAALDRAIAEAPSLRAKSLDVDAARLAARSADALPDPKLVVGTDNLPISGPRNGPDEMTMQRVGVVQDVPNPAKRRARAERASADIVAAGAATQMERREVRKAAALAWVELFYAEKRLAALDALGRELDVSALSAPARVVAGSARPADAVEVDQAKAAVEDRRTELGAAVAKARAELSRWLDDPSAEPAGAAPDWSVDPARLRAAIGQHPSLAAARAGVAQAEAEVSAARAEKRPDWSWEVAYQHRNPRFGDMVSAQVTVGLPLFASKRQDPQIAARTLQASRSRAEGEAVRRELVSQLEGDLAEHDAHHARLARAQATLVPLARKRVELETASYRAGEAGLGEVLSARQGLVEAELEALMREAEVTRDAVRLILTYGEPDQ